MTLASHVDINLRREQADPVIYPVRHLATWAVFVAIGIAASVALAGETNFPAPKYKNPERLNLERLKAAHDDVQKFHTQRSVIPPLPGLHDYRCILHAHAEDSDHTGGTLPEMLADAKKAGISAILLTDHYRPPRDFIDGRWRGIKDGVLFMPGSEVRGCLVYPESSVMDKMQEPFPAFLKSVTAGNGMIFLSHIEERTDHPMDGFTGLEICNRHYDAKKDMASLIAVALMLTDTKQLAALQEAVRMYPNELLDFQCEYPEVYLKKWDAETKRFRLTGVAANDCHHNQVFVVKMVNSETVLLGTAVDKDDQMRKVTAGSRPGIKKMTEGHKAGDILARVDIDPYERSFWNSSTHVLASKLDEPTIRTALKAGHAFVAHDWLCDATGFRFEAFDQAGKQAGVFGDELQKAEGMKLAARYPVACESRMLRDGTEIARWSGKENIELPLKDSGVYRLEAWLMVDGEARPWIFSNPIYVR